MSTFILWPETGPGPWAGVLHRAADLDTARDMTTTQETAYRALTTGETTGMTVPITDLPPGKFKAWQSTTRTGAGEP